MKFRLDDIRIEFLAEEPSPRNPRFIQGVLGVGQVGFLAVRQLIKALKAEKIAEVYSPDFLYPGSSIPDVIYTKGGTVELEDYMRKITEMQKPPAAKPEDPPYIG